MDFRRAVREAIATVIPRNDRIPAVRALEQDFREKLRVAELEYTSSGNDETNISVSGMGTFSLGYAPASMGTGTTRQLVEISWPAICEAAERVWRNPLGEWLIRIVTSHVVGGGVHYTVKVKDGNKDDKDAKAAQNQLDMFWNDPANGMDRFFPELVKFLYVYGVQVIPAFPRWAKKGGGDIGDAVVEIGSCDPRALMDVRVNPNNVREIMAVEVGTQLERKIWRVIHSSKQHKNRRVGIFPDEEKEFGGKDESGLEFDGACFYWRHGSAPFEKIGYPLLLKQVDYLDQGDRHFFDIVERVLALQQFIWDVEIKGATTKEQLNAVAKEQNIFEGPPRSRAVRFHNDNVKWNAVTPSLGMSDITPLSRWILLYILGTVGVPLHWFGEGENANRASAEAMSRPTRKQFEALQDEIKWYLIEMLQYVIDTAVLAKKLPDLDYVVEVEMPQVAVADTAGDVNALKALGEAMQVAIGAGVLTAGQATEIYDTVAGQVGVEVRDLTAEEKKEQADKKKQAEDMAKIAEKGAETVEEPVKKGPFGKPVFGKQTPKTPQEPQVPPEAKESLPAYWNTRDTESLAEDIAELPEWMREELSKPADFSESEAHRLDEALAKVETE